MAEEGLSQTEMGINTEPVKSLGGKDLPSGWPHLPPVAETNKMYEHFKRGEEAMINKYSYDLSHGDKALRYLAIEHSRDPNHPQFELLRQKFTEFNPQIVPVEGSLMPNFTAQSETDAVAQDEEIGIFTRRCCSLRFCGDSLG